VEDASRACGGAKESAAILAGKPMLKEEPSIHSPLIPLSPFYNKKIDFY
jgi:hypothetical protein